MKRKGKKARLEKAAAAPQEGGIAVFLKDPRKMFLALLWVFSAGVVFFSVLPLGKPIWWIIAVGALAFFALEVSLNMAGKGLESQRFRKAFAVGAFLFALAFFFEASGVALQLWSFRGSTLQVMGAPIEVLAAAFFGGTAWALYVPRKKDMAFAAFDTILFSVFGTLADFIFVKNGLLYYSGAWGFAYAFVSYLALWAIMHATRYEILGE